MSPKRLALGLVLVLATLYVVGAGVWALTGARPPSLDEVSASDLNVQWALGCGFNASNKAQTARLAVDSGSCEEPNDGEIGGSEWTGYVMVGRRLFAGWGDDTADHVSEVFDRAPVVQGQVIMLDDESASDMTYRARLVGVAIELPDGSIHQIGDLEVENNGWGQFVG